MTEDLFKVNFINPREIRMGSPYYMCRIEIEGNSKLKVDDAAWQNICACTDDKKYLALIEFNLTNNEPGFHIVIFNTLTGAFRRSDRIMGLVNSISFCKDTSMVRYNKFLYTGEKTDAGELIGNNDEELAFIDFE